MLGVADENDYVLEETLIGYQQEHSLRQPTLTRTNDAVDQFDVLY